MSDKVQEWMTAREITKLNISGFPKSVTGIHYYAKRRGIHLDPTLCRKRDGTTGVEYNKRILLPAFEDQLSWLTANEIVGMRLPTLPTRVDDLQAKFHREIDHENPLLVRRYGNGNGTLYHRSVIRQYEISDDWFNAEEIAKMALPGFPNTRPQVTRYMKSLGVFNNPILCRARSGSGGGYEYHIDALPKIARVKSKMLNREKNHGLSKGRHLERRPVDRLVESFPSATKITIDVARPAGNRILVRMRATGVKRPA